MIGLSGAKTGVMAPTTRPGSAPEIADYGFLSDCHGAALVDRSGSVDWWCVPRFDSASVFGRLLGAEAGHWALHPIGAFTSERAYVAETLVLRSVFTTDTGSVALTDALLLEDGARGHEIGRRSPQVMLRRVEGLTGAVDLRMELAPRMEYGRTEPHLRLVDGGAEAVGGPVTLNLTAPVRLHIDDGTLIGDFCVARGEVVELRLAYQPTFGAAADATTSTTTGSLTDTVAGWSSWAGEHTGYDGAYPELVRRSSLVLQGLTFAPSGAVVAAATTSLPETVGGSLNFDYRYAWLRDLSFTVRALWLAACPTEPGRILAWLTVAAGRTGGELIQIMYGVEGERDLSEHVLEHLPGYRGSSPVRVGNEAWKQTQLDVLGEVLDAAHLIGDRLDQLPPAATEFLVLLANRAAEGWQEPDAGMWEARDRHRHYTSSKVMCWVALDRAVALAPRLGDAADPDRWSAARDAVRAAVLTQAWSEQAQAYCGAFGSDDLDASVLLMPLVGFLPAQDTRMRSTIHAVETGLGRNGLVRRWPSDRSGFLICTYWLVECLWLRGEHQSAHQWFAAATGYANDLGLFSEEADPDSGKLLGNYPQTFSHIGLINAAWRLGQPTTDPISTQ
jgi:GH15 family glucan-1,4-alpha-glucosidase